MVWYGAARCDVSTDFGIRANSVKNATREIAFPLSSQLKSQSGDIKFPFGVFSLSMPKTHQGAG